jgi:ankyrin repeat protein
MLLCSYVLSYGRVDYAEMLLDAGASPAARNDSGKTPLELVKLNAQNPVNAATELMKRLGAGSFFQDV